MSDVDQQIERLLLIVEDDEAFARTLSRSFERRGYTVIGSETERGGLRAGLCAASA